MNNGDIYEQTYKKILCYLLEQDIENNVIPIQFFEENEKIICEHTIYFKKELFNKIKDFGNNIEVVFFNGVYLLHQYNKKYNIHSFILPLRELCTGK